MKDHGIDDWCDEVFDRLLGWELDAAEKLLLGRRPPEHLLGWVTYHLAVIAELKGDFARADELYGRAHAVDPVDCPRPVRMDEREASDLLTAVVASFPDEVRAVMDNLRIDMLEVPEPAIDRGPDTDPLVLGLYHGTPITDREVVPVGLPDTVRIFKRNIERIAANREHLVEQLRITLLHEVGHHLGWDEDDLEERGLA